MNRLVTRLYAMAALLNGGATPYPTIAADNVFDSRIDDVPDATDDLHQPTIILRSDEDEQRDITAAGLQGGRRVVFKIEMGILSAAKVQDSQGNDSYIPGWPATDAGLEAMLDLMEWQVLSALMGPSEWAQRFLRTPPDTIASVPMFIDNENGRTRLAARELTVTCDNFPADNFPPMLRTSDPPYVPALPDELVTCFATIYQDGAGDFRDYVMDIQATLLAQTLPAAAVYPTLTSVYVKEIDSDATPPPQGQEEVPQIEAEWLRPPQE